MQHMPYERMEPGDVPDDTASASRPEEEGAPRRNDPDEREEPRRTGPVQEPGRTPGSAEGPAHEERHTPSGIEPGPTPGSAEGEDTPD